MRHWLWEYLPRNKLTLGGGTVLAARWEHRESTDVDLFAPLGAFDDAEAQMTSLAASVEGRLHTGELIDAVVAKRHLRLTLGKPAGELTVFTGHDATAQPIAAHETAAGFAVHSVQEILARIHGLADFTQRGFYDFAVAALVEPDSMARVLASFDPEANRAVAHELRREPAGFAGKPLLAPAYRDLGEGTELRRCARVLFLDGVEAMADHCRHRHDGQPR